MMIFPYYESHAWKSDENLKISFFHAYQFFVLKSRLLGLFWHFNSTSLSSTLFLIFKEIYSFPPWNIGRAAAVKWTFWNTYSNQLKTWDLALNEMVNKIKTVRWSEITGMTDFSNFSRMLWCLKKIEKFHNFSFKPFLTLKQYFKMCFFLVKSKNNCR